MKGRAAIFSLSMLQKSLSSFLPIAVGIALLFAIVLLLWPQGVLNKGGTGGGAIGLPFLSIGGTENPTVASLSCAWVSGAQLEGSHPKLSSCTPPSCPSGFSKIGDSSCVLTALGSNGGSTTPVYSGGYCYNLCERKSE